MRVEFIERGPEHRVLAEVELPMPPREGEVVVLDDDTGLVVHSVSYNLGNRNHPIAIVVLKF